MTDDPTHPANPYAAEAATAPRLEDRPGYPGKRYLNAYGTDLSDEAQLGKPATPKHMPVTIVRGWLKWLDPVKGYGFISQHDGPDVLIMLSMLMKSYATMLPMPGCGIEVDVIDRGRGLMAIKVRWMET